MAPKNEIVDLSAPAGEEVGPPELAGAERTPSEQSNSVAAAALVIPSEFRMGSEEDPKEYDQSRKLFCRILAVGSLLGVIALILMLYWAFAIVGGFYWFDSGRSVNIHIILMLIFMVYLHGHASLIYRILPTQPKYTVKLMHAGLHLAAVIASAVGLAAAVNSHDISSQPHFYSLHSWIGISALSAYYLQFLGGFFTFLVPITPMNIRMLALPIHRFAGVGIFTLSIGATVTGIMLKAIGTLTFPVYMTLPPAAMLLNFSGLFVMLFGIAVGFILLDYQFRRRPRPGPEGELLLHSERSGRQVHSSAMETDQSDQAE